MDQLETSDVSLKGDVTSTLEVHDRLELKWIGTSKHVKLFKMKHMLIIKLIYLKWIQLMLFLKE